MAFMAITRKYRSLLNGIGLRSSCSSRIRRLSGATNASTLTQFPPIYTEEFEIGSRVITLETGKHSRHAQGAVELRTDGTNVLCAAFLGAFNYSECCPACMGIEVGIEALCVLCADKEAEGRDFSPLTVSYNEIYGVIPCTHTRWERAKLERELQCERLICQPIRPLFPVGFYREVKVKATMIMSHRTQHQDVMAANATSAALLISDIPWDGPIGMIRVGRINGRLVVNPSIEELNLSDLNLVYACTRDNTLSVDVQAHEISERDLEAAFRFAHSQAVKFIEPQLRLAAKARKQKEYKLFLVSERTMDKIHRLVEAPTNAVCTDLAYGKFKREEAFVKIGQDVKSVLEEEGDVLEVEEVGDGSEEEGDVSEEEESDVSEEEEDLLKEVGVILEVEGDETSINVLSKAVDTVQNQVVCRRIITEGFRLDGRRLNEIGPLHCETGDLSAVFGSTVFTCGETQVLCAVTIDTPKDAQQLDSNVGPSRTLAEKAHLSVLHAEVDFPYTVLVDSQVMALNRSTSMATVYGGSFVEKALLAVLPSDVDFPYTVLVDSEVMASDGSTSAVCGGSMALMVAGIPLRKHVAGLSMGLVTEVDPSTGGIDKYCILTDISGFEHRLSDMDFKIAGTHKGITAAQLDIKPAGIPIDIICESLRRGYKGRLQILDHMERAINEPRTQVGRNSPQYVTLKYNKEDLLRLSEPSDALILRIQEETDAWMSMGDGTLNIIAKNQSIMEKALEKVDSIIGLPNKVGGVYKGIVTSIGFQTFVEFNGGRQGILHVFELSRKPVYRISDVISVGQQLSLLCIGQDLHGDINLSLQTTLPQKNKKNDH